MAWSKKRGEAGPGQGDEVLMATNADANFAACSDVELVQACREGRSEAFVALVERYRLELFYFLSRFLHDRTAADDIFQETFLQVHLSLDSFDTQRSFKPWLFTIAANKARDWLRRNNRKINQTTTVVFDDDSENGRSVVDLIDGELPIPDDLADAKETQALVRQVIDELPAHLKEILLLAYFHQIPYKEIADSLDIPLGTVKSRLHAAVGTFAQLWKQRFGNMEPGNQ